jgi:hypothetical protein
MRVWESLKYYSAEKMLEMNTMQMFLIITSSKEDVYTNMES